MTTYTSSEIDLVREWYERDGLSGNQIATRFSREFRPVTRNAIMGVLHRNKMLKGKGRQATASRPPRVPRAPKAPPIKTAIRRPPVPSGAAAFNPGYVPLAQTASLVPLPITFLDAVNANRCLFFATDPFSPDGPDMPVCGAERPMWGSRDNRYCARHLGLMADHSRAA